MAKARKKPVIVDAVQTDKDQVLATAIGAVQVKAGEWIITDPNSGDTWPVTNEIFKRTYEMVHG